MRVFTVLISILAFAGVLYFSPKNALADVRCETQYGGGQTCVTTQLLVNKKVWDPDGKVFVDNLAASGHRFVAGDTVTFTVDIKNVGSTTLTNVNFSDTLPSFLVWQSGDSLNSTISTLSPGETKTLTIVARVISDPPGGVTCNVNTAFASTSGASDSDSAQLCVENRVKGVTTIPSTGPEQGVLVLLPALGAFGYFLKLKVGSRS